MAGIEHKIFFCEICGKAADWQTGEQDPDLTNVVLEKGKGDAICKVCLRELEDYWEAASG